MTTPRTVQVNRIVVTTLGSSERSILRLLSPTLRSVFEARVETRGPVSLPPEAYDPSRDQYHSGVLLDALARHTGSERERLLGVADVDLYTPDLNFVFGQADAERGVAVFSLARLLATDRERFVRRAATEAVHELAHTFGLGHCRDVRCVMWFSNTLDETDRKGTGFCPKHAEQLRQARANPREPATGLRGSTTRRTRS